jgi:uncharacterized protein (UPF0276 family)
VREAGDFRRDVRSHPVQDLRFELWRKVERVMCIEPTLLAWQNRRQ